MSNYGTSIFKPKLASDIFDEDDMVNPNDLVYKKNNTHFPKVSTL